MKINEVCIQCGKSAQVHCNTCREWYCNACYFDHKQDCEFYLEFYLRKGGKRPHEDLHNL